MSGGGFWTGLLAGLLAGLAGVVVLALTHPPVASDPPTLAPDALEAPSGPAAPGELEAPAGPRESGALTRPASAPPIDDGPSAETPPRLPGLATRSAEE